MDLEALTAAGLYDPSSDQSPQRAELLAFLLSEGCTIEEMQLAEQRGRLFALAGDRKIRPLVGLLTLRQAAARLGADTDTLVRAWRAFGLPVSGADAPLLRDADVEALETYLLVRDFLDENTALGVARVIGAALARITEAESSAMRAGMQDTIDLGVTENEAVTARAFAAVTGLVPRIGQILDTLHRQHLEATRVHFELIDTVVEDRTTFRCGVGFADLSGFTRLSQQLTLGSLSSVLSVFEEAATETVHAHHGRVVKFLGDAVMWVSPNAEDLARIAVEMVGHPTALSAGIEVRAGLAWGQVLAQDGDYFGTPVNLASRLVAVAEPGQVLADPELARLVGTATWLAVPGVPQVLRGFDEPVIPYVLSAG